MYLNNHTYFSLRYGTFSEKELLRLAQETGLTVLPLTDINNTSACLNFVRLAPKYGIRPILGIDFRKGAEPLFIGLAANNEGFQELNNFLSRHSHEKLEIPAEAPAFEHVKVIYPYKHVQKLDKISFASHEYIGIGLKDLPYLHRSKWIHFTDRMVILQPVTFRSGIDFNVHRLLRAIANNELLSKLSESEQANPNERFVPLETLTEGFKEYPIILKNTEKLLGECHISFDFSPTRTHQNLLSYTGNDDTDYMILEKLAIAGLAYRYDEVTEEIEARLAKELKMIKDMSYVPFFLVNWDIIQYCRRKGYFHIGRGSGANSIVAYLLGITDVDPIELDLYFERFMNLYRANPPDFDLDFSWRDREDVTRYIFERFGKKGQVALLATYSTFQHSGAVRELSKVFGLPKSEIDILSDGKFEFDKLDKLSQLVLKYSRCLLGMPNHLSVHSGGILVSEKPIHYFSATDMPPKGFPTTQFDMVISEDVGLFKYDILGQRGLGKIKDTISIIKENRPDIEMVDIHNVKLFLKDPKINYKVSQAECIGCFYVESPAMRMLLKKLGTNSYLGLVAASSIIRPGVAQSGMMREYILRHKDPERRKMAHPVMWELMEETYGVMVYQEDVIKVAHHFAGLDLGEADVLRRGMSGKFRSREEFNKVKKKFMANCREKGYAEKIIQEVWAQTESFAGYAFAKGHSASYAIESYQSLYLKTYFPREYMVAVLNNGGGFYRAETYIHEARMQGAMVHVPHLNISRLETIIQGTDIYLGFQHLSGVESKVAQGIIDERNQNGFFQSFEDFMERVPMGIEQIDILLRIGAFDFTGVNKRTLLWKAYYRVNKQPKRSIQEELFKIRVKDFTLPKLTSTDLENVFDQIELLGFPLCDPFYLLLINPANELLAQDMKNFINKTITLYGYLVTTKNTSTSKGDSMYFGTFLDKSGHWIDTVHFPPVAKQFPFRGRGIYELTGKVMDEFGFLTLEVSAMKRLPYILDPRYITEEEAAKKKVA